MVRVPLRDRVAQPASRLIVEYRQQEFVLRTFVAPFLRHDGVHHLHEFLTDEFPLASLGTAIGAGEQDDRFGFGLDLLIAGLAAYSQRA